MADRILDGLPGAPHLPAASFRILDSVEKRISDHEVDALRSRLAEALRHFEGLAGETVTVATRTRPDGSTSRWNPYASADPVNRIIRVPVYEPVSNVTLFHELGHCAIQAEIEDGADHPRTSEEFCSLYTIARQPPGLIDEDRIPYFGNPGVPTAEWPRIAREALEYREEKRNYIQKAREWLAVGGGGRRG